jgi:phosphatidylglycerophosphatase C
VLGLLLRQPWRVLRAPLLLPALVAFALKGIDHGGLKSAVIRRLLGGCTRAQVQAWTAEYVQQVVPARLFTAALAAIATHRAAGDRLVLLSASPDLFVPALAAEMGFDQVLCTGVAWTGEQLDGALTTANRRGEEKLQCLAALREGHPGCHVTGYGNSEPDLVHLQACDSACYINPRRAQLPHLRSAGITALHWH